MLPPGNRRQVFHWEKYRRSAGDSCIANEPPKNAHWNTPWVGAILEEVEEEVNNRNYHQFLQREFNNSRRKKLCEIDASWTDSVVVTVLVFAVQTVQLWRNRLLSWRRYLYIVSCSSPVQRLYRPSLVQYHDQYQNNVSYLFDVIIDVIFVFSSFDNRFYKR